jgi:hypothetical protein
MVMRKRKKIIFTQPRQLPLFEEEDDGSLKPYIHS